MGKQSALKQSALNGAGRVLIVEDNDDSRWLLSRACETAGYSVSQAASGQKALDKLGAQPFDVMLLDLHLPDMHGVEVLKEADSLQPDLITIILTAKPTLDSAIAAVKGGVVDYLRKPAATRDVLEVIAANLMRRAQQHKRLIQLGTIGEELVNDRPDKSPTRRGNETGEENIGKPELQFNRARREVKIFNDDSRTVTLTKGEAAVLAVLLDHAGEVQSSEDLVHAAWGEELEPSHAASIIRPLIFRLRQKLEEEPSTPHIIRTVRGSGYVFEAN